MSDGLADTPVVARLYCPMCEPDRDNLAEVLDIMWCTEHQPSRDGALDRVVTPSQYISGSGEAGGEDNRRFCDWLHRGKE